MNRGSPVVSVAMATHDGERFLAQQLESLATQNRLPLELVVCDDASSDGTVDLLREFARSAPFGVRIIENESNRGYIESFLQAARICRGDLLAFCDQDDVWQVDKLARCEAEFVVDGDVTLVVHSGRIIDAAGCPERRRFPDFPRRSTAEPGSLPLLIAAPGFALVFRRWILTLGWGLMEEHHAEEDAHDGFFPHDTWIGFAGCALGKVVRLPDELVLYRQHGGNHFGAPEADSLSARLRHTLGWSGSEAKRLHGSARRAEARAGSLERIVGQHRNDLSQFSVRGVETRAGMWRRLAVVSERRAELYEQPAPSFRACCLFASSVGRGDYGPRAKGGSGAASLARDLAHVAGVLPSVKSGTDPGSSGGEPPPAAAVKIRPAPP